MTARCQTESEKPVAFVPIGKDGRPEWAATFSADQGSNLDYPCKLQPLYTHPVGVAQAPAQSQVDAAAAYLVSTIERKLWSGIRSDGRSQDSGFVPFHTAQFSYAVNSNARQEDYRDVVREISRILSVPSASGGDVAAEAREPIAWRVKFAGSDSWILYYSDPRLHNDRWEWFEPLYAGTKVSSAEGK